MYEVIPSKWVKMISKIINALTLVIKPYGRGTHRQFDTSSSQLQRLGSDRTLKFGKLKVEKNENLHRFTDH